MMRKFVHKEKWSIATLKENYYCITTTDDDPLSWRYIIPKRFIEQQPDVREEVIEQDWIEDAFKCYRNQYENNVFSEIYNINFRYACEKYAPKVRKFTRDEVCKWSNKAYFDWAEERYLIDFLEEHNLLSKDAQEESIVWEWNIACKHESTWQIYTSDPPQYKCRKCWEFYLLMNND